MHGQTVKGALTNFLQLEGYDPIQVRHMPKRMRTHMLTCIHAHVHAAHARLAACIGDMQFLAVPPPDKIEFGIMLKDVSFAYDSMHLCTHVRSPINTHAHTCTHAHARAHAHTLIHTHARAPKHARSRTRTRRCACADTRTRSSFEGIVV